MHIDLASDVMVVKVNTAEYTFAMVTQEPFNLDMVGLLKSEPHARFASILHRTLQGLDSAIYPDSPPKNY